MIFHKKFLSLMFCFILLCSASASAESYHFATTDMTWAEFYAGETGYSVEELEDSGLDAISTPTVTHGAMFTHLVTEITETSTTISGVKDVQVRMDDEVYELMKGDERFTFTDETFSEYKDVNSDGSFGAMVTETETLDDAVVTILSGASSTWGQYTLKISNAEITVGTGARDISYWLGGLIETTDGEIYGLRHDCNLWSSYSDIAFCVNENYVEPHGNGVERDYDYTADLEGKTIAKITYILKDQPDVIINCSLPVKSQTDSSVSPVTNPLDHGTDVKVEMAFNVPDDADYSLSTLSKYVYVENARHGRPGWIWSALDSSLYEYSDGVITVKGDVGGDKYKAVFSSEKYVDISTEFEILGYFATTDMTWAEFYAGETGKTASELEEDGLDAVSSSTPRVGGMFTQLVTEENDIGGLDITGVKAVQVRMTADVYNSLSDKSRYTFTDEIFTEYKDVDSDGNFGAMVTETTTFDDAVVTLASGASSTWGTYMLNISNAEITLTNDDERLDLGAVIETSDGNKYGLRHNSNLWFSAASIAITVDENYKEPHGLTRDYDYTADLEGKTITKITYMLKNQPDVVINCEVFMKTQTTASVTPVVEDPFIEGSCYILPGEDVEVVMSFSGLPDDSTYETVSSFSIYDRTLRGGRGGWSALTTDDYSYSADEKTLTINRTLVGGERFRVIFSDENYTDIGTEIKVFTSDATNLIINDENNSGSVNFLLTPYGAIEEIDENLDSNNFVNASDYTVISDNLSTESESGISGTGFNFDVAVNVPDGKTAIVGFGKMAYLTSSNLGSELYGRIYSRLSELETGESGFIEFPVFSELNKFGLAVKVLTLDGTLRDISSLCGAGVMLLDDSILVFYGSMAVDCDFGEITEGECYPLSWEGGELGGEILISDGVRDGHINITAYLEVVEIENGGGSGGDGTNEGTTQKTVTPSAVTPSEPKNINVTEKSDEILSGIKEASGLDLDGVEVEELNDDNADLTSRTVNDISASEKKYLSDNKQVAAAVLPIIEVDEDKILVFNVDLSMLNEGVAIYWQSMVKDSGVSNAEFKPADDDDKSNAAVFYGDDGEETNTVPASQSVDVAAYFEAGKTYAPLITTRAYTSGDDGDDDKIGSSGGGCNGINSISALMLLGMSLLIFRKK